MKIQVKKENFHKRNALTNDTLYIQMRQRGDLRNYYTHDTKISSQNGINFNFQINLKKK